jgi:hypothetical protein
MYLTPDEEVETKPIRPNEGDILTNEGIALANSKASPEWNAETVQLIINHPFNFFTCEDVRIYAGLYSPHHKVYDGKVWGQCMKTVKKLEYVKDSIIYKAKAIVPSCHKGNMVVWERIDKIYSDTEYTQPKFYIEEIVQPEPLPGKKKQPRRFKVLYQIFD